MRTTYRIDLRVNGTSEWRPQTRFKTKWEAEVQAALWRSRGYEVKIVTER